MALTFAAATTVNEIVRIGRCKFIITFARTFTERVSLLPARHDLNEQAQHNASDRPLQLACQQALFGLRVMGRKITKHRRISVFSTGVASALLTVQAGRSDDRRCLPLSEVRLDLGRPERRALEFTLCRVREDEETYWNREIGIPELEFCDSINPILGSAAQF